MKKWFMGREENRERRGFLWNLAASAVNAAEAVIILMIATRFAGMENAGILTISFTVANLMMCIGKYGVRNYQVTDIADNKSLNSYFRARMLTLGLMLVFTLFFLIYSFAFSRYYWEKAVTVFFTVAIYALEAFEDVFLSEFQRRGQLDTGAKMFTLRWIITLIVWGAAIMVLKSVMLPTILAFGADFFVLILMTTGISRDLFEGSEAHGKKEIGIILRDCLPLCVVAVLSIYLPNAAKYAIDMWLDDGIQACYGFIAMPIFVIDVISFVIFQPMLKGLSEKWNRNEMKNFAMGIGKLFLLILAISVLCLIAGYFLGIPVLSILYAVDLAEFKREFMILLVAGAAQAYIGLFVAILVIFRKQILMLPPFLIVTAGIYIVLNLSVPRYGIWGAAVTNAAALFWLGLLLCAEIVILFIRKLKENKKKEQES